LLQRFARARKSVFLSAIAYHFGLARGMPMIRNSICGRQFVQAFLSLTVSLIFAEQSKATIVAPCVVDDLSAQAVTPLVDFVSQIQPIFELNCSGCHIGGVSAGLNLAANVSYGNLVNAAVYTLGVGGFRVAPFDTANSFMFNKVNCTNLDSIPGQPFGLRMPHSGPIYLTKAEQAYIRDWINQGATRQGDRVFVSNFE
jgi:hypothetical protein